MKKRHVMRALVAAATALALTACGSTGSSDTSKSTSTASAASTSSGSEADTENTITIPAGESVSQDSDVTAMIAVDFTTMDPMDTSDTLSGGVQRMMMDGLFGFDENMQIIPMLATSYEANDEATEYTIHLREGVSFTDGTPWNADALIANVNKWADKSLGLKRTTFLCNVLGRRMATASFSTPSDTGTASAYRRQAHRRWRRAVRISRKFWRTTTPARS